MKSSTYESLPAQKDEKLKLLVEIKYNEALAKVFFVVRQAHHERKN